MSEYFGKKSILKCFLSRFVIGHHHRGFWPSKGWSFTHITKVVKFYNNSGRDPTYVLVQSHICLSVKLKMNLAPQERVFEFYKLYLPSALAIASDFWRVTIICQLIYYMILNTFFYEVTVSI